MTLSITGASYNLTCKLTPIYGGCKDRPTLRASDTSNSELCTAWTLGSGVMGGLGGGLKIPFMYEIISPIFCGVATIFCCLSKGCPVPTCQFTLTPPPLQMEPGEAPPQAPEQALPEALPETPRQTPPTVLPEEGHLGAPKTI